VAIRTVRLRPIVPRVSPPDSLPNLPELSPTDRRVLEIDIELRDLWGLLGTSEIWEDVRQLTIAANVMRVAYERGFAAGEEAGFDGGYTEGLYTGYPLGYEEGLADGNTAGRSTVAS